MLKFPVTLLSLLLLASVPAHADLLLRNARIFDGTGRPGYAGDVRIRGERIAQVGPHLQAGAQEEVRDLHGLALAPGFIDMHSHGDQGLLKDLDAGTIVRQGVTLILVGQDGSSNFPLADFYRQLGSTPASINVASMVGFGTLRQQVMGKDLYRPATAAELARIQALLQRELAAGAFGLSTGLEYEDQHSSSTAEVIAVAKVAAATHGFYISHVRDEAGAVFEAWDELMQIGREAHLPVEITHIKLGATPDWHLAAQRMPGYFERAQREHIDLSADVYPYTAWASTLRVIVEDRDFYNPQRVERALRDNGGPAALLVTRYDPEPRMAGKTLEQIASAWQVSAVEAYMRMIRATEAEVGSGKEMEGVIGTSMSEDDVRWFVAQPQIMICTDGELHGAHPRGAGAFPRVLGRYVREQKALTLEQAIRKMTDLPAQRLGLTERGRIAPGRMADLVVFDPATVLDQATFEHPEDPPRGIPGVMVAGTWVVDAGQLTGRHPGRVLRKPTL